MKINKKVWVSWPDKDVVNSDHPMIKKGLARLIEINPDWEVIVHTDDEVDQYLLENMDGSLYDMIKDVGIVDKVDVWRLLKLYREGGVYVDVDRWCNKKLSDLIDEDTICVLLTNGDSDFSHDMMISAMGNPILEAALEMYFERRRHGHTGTYFLGAQTYMHAITSMLFGEPVNTNPPEGVMSQMRDLINTIPNFKCIKEELPNNTFIYEGDGTQDEWESMKRSLYSVYGLKHWTGEW